METLTFIYTSALQIAEGVPVVLILTILSFFPALSLGIIGGVLGSLENKSVRQVVSIYVYIFRSVPFLMFAFLVFYSLPQFGIDVSAFTTATIALALSHGAYMTEIIRGGLRSFEKGQEEAGRALGLGFFQRLRYVTIPQTLMAIVPTLVGQVILMVKDTSIVSIIGISEISRIGREIISRSYEPFSVLILVAAIYFVICYGAQAVATSLERKAQRILKGH